MCELHRRATKRSQDLVGADSCAFLKELRPMTKDSCTNYSPAGFTGRWQDWHRGHGCPLDDGKPRSDAGVVEIRQMVENGSMDGENGFLTDAELKLLRVRTTSSDTLLIRAIAELQARRQQDAIDKLRGK